jgi:hypothetical protein
MVGASTPLNHDDQMRHFMVAEKGCAWGEYEAELDVINLLQGRDFLKEKKKYDFVILHSIFHTRPEFMQRHLQDGSMKKEISPLHTIERWQRRLVSTKATKIFVWELRPFSLSGWHLNELPGYKIESRDHRLTVYIKEE